MIYLGRVKAGATVKYRANFHDDTGTLADPTSPEAQIEKPDDTFAALTAPAKINLKTGHYGGSVDTTGYAVGQYIIRMAGTVATAKVVATEFCFEVEANNNADIYTRIGAPAGASVSADLADVPTVAEFNARSTADPATATNQAAIVGYIDTEIAAIKADTAAILDDTGTSGVVLPQAQADKVWLTTTRAITDKVGFALSAAGIQAIWDALTSALTVVGSIGKRLVDYVDAAISSRSTYAGADTAGTTALLARATEARLAELDAANLPTDVAAIPTTPLLTGDSRLPATIIAAKADVDAVARLIMKNHVEDDIVRDANGLKTSSTIYCYDSAANAGVHDKVTGIMEKYNVTVTYTAQRMAVFKSVKA